MRIRIVDAFTDRPFAGNPAGVLLLDAFPDDDRLQKVALEVNHAETAFAHPLPEGGEADWALRWFTPATEVDMCGHATLATAHVLHTTRRPRGPGALRHPQRRPHRRRPTRTARSPWTSRPRRSPRSNLPDGLAEALGAEPLAVLDTGPNIGDLLVEVADEKTVRALAPDLKALAALLRRGVIATARAENPAGATTSSPAASSRRRHRRGPGDRQRPHRARPLLVRARSAAPTSPASRPPPAPASSAPACAATAPS